MYFDAHSDIWTDVTVRRLAGERDVLRRRHLDRLRQGNVEGGIFALWIDGPFQTEPLARTRQMMDCIRGELAECDAVRVVCNDGEITRAKSEGKFYILIGAEGLAAIGTDLGKLDDYYAFGVRHAMLTWNEENALAAGAATGKDSGLTPAGREAVRRIQEKGMLLDLSHLNEAGFWDVTRLATRPVIASHSNARALCDVPRNLTDDQLRAIRDLGGVVGLNVFHRFISPEREAQTVENLARHGAHMVDVMGIDHVGCGFDFCEFLESEAGEPVTAGLADCREIGNLFACFAKLGMSREEMDKIACQNFRNVIKQTIG
ncbi:MAG: membrane dipeptidase [Oscillibacter sp.]